MENVRSALVAKTLGVGVLALLVLALAACGSEETTSDPEVVSVGRARRSGDDRGTGYS
jgi:hypothetical protein